MGTAARADDGASNGRSGPIPVRELSRYVAHGTASGSAGSSFAVSPRERPQPRPSGFIRSRVRREFLARGQPAASAGSLPVDARQV